MDVQANQGRVEVIALRNKPAKFEGASDVLNWIPLHLNAVAFDKLPFDRQAMHIVLVVAALREFVAVRWSAGAGDGAIRGIRVINVGNGVLVEAVRDDGAPIFEISAMLAAMLAAA